MTRLRALTMLNSRGDTTIVWTPDRDDEMEKIIEAKMAQGCIFYIIDPRFGTREKLTDAGMRRMMKGDAPRMMAIPDKDFLRFVGGTPQQPTADAAVVRGASPATPVEVEEVPTAAVVPTPKGKARVVRRAKSAREVAQNESIGVSARGGG